MKKIYGLLGAAALLMMSACSNDSIGSLDMPDAPDAFQTSYLSINIVPTPDNGTTRADVVSGDPEDAEYEQGYDTENEVTKVRFYFFNDGAIAPVKKDGTNFIDFEPKENDGDDMPNVEKKLEATIVINTKDGDKPSNLPNRIVAVLNPDEEGLTTTDESGNLS